HPRGQHAVRHLCPRAAAGCRTCHLRRPGLRPGGRPGQGQRPPHGTLNLLGPAMGRCGREADLTGWPRCPSTGCARRKGAAGTHGKKGERFMSIEENKAIVGRWFTEFWGKDFNPGVIDELAAPDIRFDYSLHAPLRGRDAVRSFAQKFRAAFPDLGFWGTADLIAEGDYVVGQWEG